MRTGTPARLAADAPVNAVTDSVCPANVWRRSTMNQPITPAMTATIVPAASACCMNGNVKSACTSVTGFPESPVKTELVGMVPMEIGRADHHEPPVGGAKNVDRHAVQRAQRLGGDDVFRRALHRGSARDVDDAVEVADDRVDVVRDEQHCDVLLATDVADERGNACLVRQVEAVERLVEQQQLRTPRERLRDEQSLLLAAGELADRLARVRRGADERDHLVDALRGGAAARPRDRQSPTRAVEAEPHEVDAADARALVEAPPLRQIADAVVRGARRSAEHGCAAGRERLEAEDRADERRLAGAVRPEHGDEPAELHGDRDVAPYRRAADSRRGALERDGGHGRTPFASASTSASSWRTCHCWKVADAGVSVSVIVVTGMPFFRAASVMRATSGVLFWLLKTQTLICFLAIWRSIVVLSDAVGSVPSLIACRNEAGVMSLSPSACASGAKMLSDAPTGVPPNRRLIVAMRCSY